MAISAQVDCTGCTPVFNTIEDTISVSCEITNPPAFPSYTNGCTGLDMSEATFVATLGQSTSCEGNIALAIGAGQDLCLTLSGFQNAGLAPSDRFFVGSESLSWTHYANGSATLTGVVYNEADVSDAYAMEVYMEGGFNWTEWDAMGNLVLDALEQGTEQDWIYFILVNNMSKLTGVGVNAGKTIRLTHSPSSEDLGFQLGSMGANNINMNHGLGGWVNWEVLEAGNTLGGVGNITIDLTNCVNSEYTCADDNDILYRFYAGNICGYDQVDILIDHTDNTPPSWTYVPGDLTQECSDTPILEDATATDLCSELSISIVSDTLFGSAEGNYIVTRTFTAEDACGNATSATQTITIIDTTSPVLTIPADYTAECSDAHPMEDASTTDNCGVVTIDLLETTINGACAGEYTITRSFTATDDAGNSTSETQTITIVDTTAPVLTIPADYTAECSDTHPMNDATATDNCGEITIDLVETTMSGTCAGEYTVTREFTATDECGNASSATQTITVVDTTLPEFTSIPADYTAECSDDHPMLGATAIDNCGEVTISVVETTTDGACAGDYTITRTFSATDECGNATSATQTIAIVDTTSPILTIPADYTAECSDDQPMLEATATDNCGVVTITVIETTIAGVCAGDYTITRAFTATDECGNATSATQTITSIDTTAPSLIAPENLSLSCLDSNDFGTPTSSDFCSDVVLTIVSDTTLGDCPAQYMITRTFVASDNCGNSATASQTIEYSDITPPSFGSTESYLEIACSEEALLDAEAFDSCSDVSELTYIDNFGSGGCMSPTSNIVRVLTAVDACGNVASMEQTIQFIDTVAPIFTYIPSDTAIDCSTDYPFDFPVITDGCSDVNLEYTLDTISMSASNDYTVSVLWTATDGCGNEKTVSQLISVSDTEAPIFTQAPNLPAYLEIGTPLPSCNTLEWTASDNCYASNKIIFDCSLDTVFTDNGPCIGPYEIHYAYSLSDPSGNTSEFSHVITMTDLAPPVWISIPENAMAACDEEIIWEEPVANGVNDLLWEITIDTVPGICQNAYELVRT
ncbi:MAG: hypothetical protein O3A35_05465, partial [Bacteroidetes bacterium]|nr:hypothetical protein [Bacteroidota bacterium]